MRKALLSAVAVGAMLFGSPATAADNPACAMFQQPLAYNACLARFGPHARELGAAPAPRKGAEEAPMVANRSWSRPEVRGRRGRMRVEFDVGGSHSRRRH